MRIDSLVHKGETMTGCIRKRTKVGVGAAVLALFAMFVLSACGGGGSSSSSSESSSSSSGSSEGGSTEASSEGSVKGETFKLGFVGGLSGPTAAYGKQLKQGTEAAINYLESSGSGSGVAYELSTKDGQSDPAKDIAAVKELVGEGSQAILGDLTAGADVGFLPYLTREKILSVNYNDYGYSEDIGTTYPYAFTVGDPETAFSEVPMKYVAEQGVKVVGDLYDTSPFGEAQHEIDVEKAKEDGIKLVSESYPAEGDASAQIASLKSAGAEVVFLWTYLPVPPLLQFNSVGWAPPVFGGQVMTFPTTLGPVKHADPELAENLYGFMAPKNQTVAKVGEKPTDPVVLGWQEKYEEMIGRPLTSEDSLSAFAFDTVMVIDGGIKLAQSTDPVKIAEAMSSEQPLPGVRWNYEFGTTPESRQGVPASAQEVISGSTGAPGGIFVAAPEKLPLGG
jgi:branched-chain amino acid transport system substrate-binding protein